MPDLGGFAALARSNPQARPACNPCHPRHEPEGVQKIYRLNRDVTPVSAVARKEGACRALTRDDARDAFEERAAILEFDGGFSRTEAEEHARREIAAGLPARSD